MEKSNLKIKSISDAEVLAKSISYLSYLFKSLPSNLLKDTCAGARASLYVLYRYFIMEE